MKIGFGAVEHDGVALFLQVEAHQQESTLKHTALTCAGTQQWAPSGCKLRESVGSLNKGEIFLYFYLLGF